MSNVHFTNQYNYLVLKIQMAHFKNVPVLKISIRHWCDNLTSHVDVFDVAKNWTYAVLRSTKQEHDMLLLEHSEW